MLSLSTPPKQKTKNYLHVHLFKKKKIQSNHVWYYVLHKEMLYNYKNEMQVNQTHFQRGLKRAHCILTVSSKNCTGTGHTFDNSCWVLVKCWHVIQNVVACHLLHACHRITITAIECFNSATESCITATYEWNIYPLCLFVRSNKVHFHFSLESLEVK